MERLRCPSKILVLGKANGMSQVTKLEHDAQ
jgi:hypothetical protein